MLISSIKLSPLRRSILCSLRRCELTRLVRGSASSPNDQSSESDDYFAKSARMKRPLSPFVIYKPQLTTVLSITHRMTGIALAVLIYGGGIGALFLTQTNFAQVLCTVQTSVPYPLIFAFKVLAGTSLVYHLVNGVRHLAWDLGYGFSLKQLYTSGYVVIGITVLAALAFIINNY